MHDLIADPGLLYVTATVLPLVSFVLLFVGGRRWGRWGAYLACAAIIGSFVLSVVGFGIYVQTAPHHEHSQTAAASQGAGHAHAGAHSPATETTRGIQPPWSGSIYWAVVHYLGESEPAAALRLGYYVDGLTVAMFLMITLVASSIHIYSLGYMAEEQEEWVEDHQAHVRRRGRFTRFFMYLSLFCFSMLNLVLADNLFQIFISWELVGICSYLLIGYYYERRSAANAANKAFITNRVGDAGFIVGLLILWTYVGDFNVQHVFDTVRSPAVDSHGEPMPQGRQFVRVTAEVDSDGHRYYRADDQGDQVLLFRGHVHAPEKVQDTWHYEADMPTMPYWLLVVAGIGLFLGCVGKSAQFPLHVWLPDAMEGPTPVSALIHAATMVAAGVYLVGRVFPVFVPDVLLLIAYTGGLTLFVAATIAIVQTDIKRVLAYSTVSQLGYMMLALGVGGWVAGLFHLLTHAFFKALLFLCSGSVIYGCHHEQDMLRMGGLYARMKITAWTMLVGVLAIAGTPLFSGWYSKDAILVQALSFVSLNPRHFLLFLLPLLTAGITAFYMFRLWLLTFAGEPRDRHVFEHAHESPWVMTGPLVLLAFFSVVVAWGPNPFDVQGSWLEHFLHQGQPATLDHEKGYELAVVASQAATRERGGNYLARDSWLYPLFEKAALGPHDLAGALGLLVAAIGTLLALGVYYWRVLDAEEARRQFARVHAFLMEKWYFDALYSVAVVRPAGVVARACRWFDLYVIDGIVDNAARATVRLSQWDGRFDLGIVDGLVNLTADIVYAVGRSLRAVQTGLLRNYILFLAVAAVGLFALLLYLMALAG